MWEYNIKIGVNGIGGNSKTFILYNYHDQLYYIIQRGYMFQPFI